MFEISYPVRSGASAGRVGRGAWLLIAVLGSACSPSAAPEPQPPTAPTPMPVASSEVPASTSTSAAPSEEGGTAASMPPELADTAGSRERDSTEQMIAFFEVGRGERVADLGGVSGYSLLPIRKAVGRAGVLYVRRRPPPPVDAGQEVADAAPIIWMDTPDEAPLIPEAQRLNLVTLLFAYHSVIAAGHDRKKLNQAVLRALEPGGHYVIADHAAPPGSGLGAALQQDRIEEGIVRAEVEAAGFVFVEAAAFIPSSARSAERSPTSQYVLKFRKPR